MAAARGRQQQQAPQSVEVKVDGSGVTHRQIAVELVRQRAKLPVAKTAPRQKLLAELTRDHNTQVKKLQKLTRPAHRPPRSPWRRSTLCHHPLEDARETRGRPRVIPP